MTHEKKPPSSHSSLSPPPLPHPTSQAAQYSSSSSEDEDLVDETASTAWVGAGGEGGFDEAMDLEGGGSSEDEGYTVRVSSLGVGVVRGGT